MLNNCGKILGALALVFTLVSPVGYSARKINVDVDIYGINDFRGALRKEADYPGATQLGGVINKLRAENPEGMILLGGGNMLFGTIESDEHNGMPTVEAMNIMKFDANVTGSHFFDFKPEIFKEQLGLAKFPYLACNVAAKEGTPLFQPYVMLEREGLKIAVIGVTTKDPLREASPDNLKNFEFLDSVASTQKCIDEVKAQGADIVVLLMHCGVTQRVADGALRGEGIDILSKLHGADVVFTGDSQSVITGRYNGVPVLQAGSHGRYIAKAHVVYDVKEKKVDAVAEEMIKVADQVVPPDTAIAQLVNPICAEVDAKFGEVLTTNATTLVNKRDDLSLVADYFTDLLRKYSGASLVILNGGAFRSSLPAGNVTARNVEEIYPFRGQAVIMTLRGSDILAALDYGIDNPKVGQGRFSGIRLAVEPDLPQGSKIVDNVLPDGTKLNPSGYYTVLTNSFLAKGGDGYTWFKNSTKTTVYNPDIKALFRKLVKEAGPINYKDDYRFSVGELR